jgi:hypothetical protein
MAVRRSRKKSDFRVMFVITNRRSALKLGEFHKNLAYSGGRDQHTAVATCWSAGWSMSAYSQLGQILNVG